METPDKKETFRVHIASTNFKPTEYEVDGWEVGSSGNLYLYRNNCTVVAFNRDEWRVITRLEIPDE